VTARQLTLGDCEPLWHDWDQLCQRHAREREIERDLRHQGLTGRRKWRIVDVPVVGEWL
jgi:hypothetical protein